MSQDVIPALNIGDLEIRVPIIQGGMGVRVSGASLASAAANAGCAGIIASAGLGLFDDLKGSASRKLGEDVLRNEIRKAKSLSDGVIGVNIMVALSNYENLVRVADEEKADLIISGAGLPLSLPAYVSSRHTKLVPIVSSARTLRIICKRWKHHYDRLPDAVVVEGVRAGGGCLAGRGFSRSTRRSTRRGKERSLAGRDSPEVVRGS